jgi:hypothetical protein
MLGVLAAVLLCPFIVPIPTHALLIDLSSPAGAAISNDMRRHWQLIQLAAIIDVLLLACVIWAAWRVIRADRQNRNSDLS